MTPVDSLVITTGKVVLFHYTLRDPAGDVIHTSSEGPPMPYLHGAGNIVPGLENAMSGRAVGEQFEVIVAPEDGYGPRELPGPQSIPRNAFPASAPISAGMQFMAQPPGGPPMPLWIVAVQDDVVRHHAPFMGVVDVLLGPLDEFLAGALITDWRDEVWERVLDFVERHTVPDRTALAAGVAETAVGRAHSILLKSLP